MDSQYDVFGSWQGSSVRPAFLFLLGFMMLAMSPVSHATDAVDYFAKAQLAHRKGDVGSAERYYHRALRADVHRVEAAAVLVDLYYVQGRTEEALRVLEQALETNGDNGQLWARKGLLHRAAGQTKAARAAYERALALAPEDEDVLARAAGFYQWNGNRAKAEELSQARRALPVPPRP
jgi:tetratricopeptide (TPR) repeat protein